MPSELGRQVPEKNITKDLRVELDKLEQMIAQLRVDYEQYFIGLVQLAPERQHNAVKKKLRELRKAPFRSNAINFRLKALESRYQAFNSYWQRVAKEREEGTYSKDVFKANLRERYAAEDAWNETSAGKAEKGMQNLFQTYKDALERHSGKKQQLDFKAFEKSLIEKAKLLREQGHKVSFRVVVENGKVTLKAKVKKGSTEGASGIAK